jgi:hypothetical protein
LNKIKEALSIYINLPQLDESDFSQMGNGDVAFYQLQANISHLKSQLILANATLQIKKCNFTNATNIQLQTTKY